MREEARHLRCLFSFGGVGDYFRRLFQYRTYEGGKSGHPPRLSTNQLEIRD